MHTASFCRVPIPFLLVLALVSCTPAPEQGSFITYLGQDVFAIENYSFANNSIEAEVTLRTLDTTIRHLDMEHDEAGIMRRLAATVRDPAFSEAPPLSKDLLQATSASCLMPLGTSKYSKIPWPSRYCFSKNKTCRAKPSKEMPSTYSGMRGT